MTEILWLYIYSIRDLDLIDTLINVKAITDNKNVKFKIILVWVI
jgi:hypothetical protein